MTKHGLAFILCVFMLGLNIFFWLETGDKITAFTMVNIWMASALTIIACSPGANEDA